MISLRKFTSLSITISFIVMVYSGIFLFISPKGRVANWTNWEILGLTKHQYISLHITFMVLFIVGMLLHLYLNWSPLMSYLKNKERIFSLFTKEFVLALGLALVFIFGTLYQIPPFKTFVNFEDTIKAGWEKKQNEPPIAHAELLTLKEFTAKTDLDLDKSISLLKKQGFVGVGAEKTLASLAEENKVSPTHIYQIISNTQNVNNNAAQKRGIGRMSLEEACKTENLNLDVSLRILKEKGIKADKNSQMKQIADELGVTPVNLLKILAP
ncbi:MAG: DUF4405 domain-containing protein [Sulfurospirillaceae bacterium]|nr:DUF4405 domain-containing protein [Sulfurospirillaceae bacterium]